ncbi:hypothetical protein [Inquilinus sp. CA228]|uniref:hypothetical protein n=1 Tax=Inquilinus sp. CA228 TaxID=3455609 RepID=UPI003F8D0CD4
MRRLGPILLGTIPLWLAGAALAQATPEGAAELRDGLNQMLQPILGLQVQRQPLFTGPITVEPAGAGYTVVFPGVHLMLDTSTKTESRTLTLRCEAQTYRAASAGAATWRLESDQPINCAAEPSGAPRATMISRALQAHLMVDLDQKLFTESEVRADSLAIGQDGQPGKVTIDRVSWSSRVDPAADPGRHDAAFRMETRGLSALDEKGIERFAVGHSVYDATMGGMDVRLVLAAYGEILGAYGGMMEETAAALSDQKADPKQVERLPLETVKKMMSITKRMVAGFGDAGEFSGTVTDLRVKAPDVQVTVDRLRFAEGYGGASTPQGTGVLELEMAGLGLAPKLPFAQWIPADATVRLNAGGIPWVEVATAYMAFLDASASQWDVPNEAEQRMAQAMTELGGILRQAGSRLAVTSFQITAPEAAVDLSGAVQGKDSAAHGVTADLDLRVTNLDGLIKFLQGLPDGAQAAAGLSMAEVMGRQATADDGRSARDYDIVVDEAGKILVNGTDLAVFAPK